MYLRTNIISLVILSMTFAFLSSGAQAFNNVKPTGRQVIEYGPGVHTVEFIVLDKPNALLEGAGRGVTILKSNKGIRAIAPNPIIRNLTIVGNNSHTGLTLRDTWSAQVQNVEIENYKIGMMIELTDEGRKTAGGDTIRGWPSSLTPGPHWGSRVTLTEIREVEIIGKGDGIILENRLPQGNSARDGSFFTATKIWGGHIYVQGRALVIGDHVWNTALIGTFIDIGKGGGIFLKSKALRLNLIGVTLDHGSKKRKKKLGVEKIIAFSYRAANTVKFDPTTNLNRNEIIVVKKQR